jgi:hypothetical protein
MIGGAHPDRAVGRGFVADDVWLGYDYGDRGKQQ